MTARFMTPIEAARRLEVGERTFRRWLAEGKLPPGAANKLPGGRWFVSTEWVESERRKKEVARIPTS